MKKILKFISLFLVLAIIGCSKDDGEISFEDQLAKDLALIDNHILEKDINAEMHDSGIWFINSEIGEGESPSKGDLVVVKFQLAKFDEVVLIEDTIGITIPLIDPTIKSLQLMIPEMRVGGKMKFFTPSGYGFGSNSIIGIPANTNLVLWIELVDIVKNESDQFFADRNIIDEFLMESNIEAQIHESGIRYTVQQEGDGDSATADDQITVSYKGTLLNGLIFDQNVDGVQFPLANLIEAWKIMIPTMKEGGIITIYAPSKYCYGTTGTSLIAPNSILVFEIQLVKVD